MANRPESFRWRIGEILIQRGWLDWDMLDQALAVQDKCGLMLGEVLSKTDSVAIERVYRALAIQYQLPFVDLNHYTLNPEALRALPQHMVYQYRIVPIAIDKNRLMVAVTHPRDRLLTLLIQAATHLSEIQMVMACPQAVDKVICDYYGAPIVKAA